MPNALFIAREAIDRGKSLLERSVYIGLCLQTRQSFAEVAAWFEDPSD